MIIINSTSRALASHNGAEVVITSTVAPSDAKELGIKAPAYYADVVDGYPGEYVIVTDADITHKEEAVVVSDMTDAEFEALLADKLAA